VPNWRILIFFSISVTNLIAIWFPSAQKIR